MPVIETRDLKKNYGSVVALTGVNLEVKEGEALGFIGPNGAGKTTTIRILLGLLRRSGGTASLFGRDAWRDAVEIHRRLAYVAEDVRLWPNLTGGEIIDLFTTLRGKSDARRRADLIERFELDPTKRFGTYSKGNRQKVALISAFSSDVDLYILDEPTSGLDPLKAAVFQDCVAELKRSGKTVLMSSHILADVERLCNRFCIIKQGAIVDTGTPAELRHLAQFSVRVETEHRITGLDDLAGVHNPRISDARAEFQADSEHMNEILAHLTRFRIRSLASMPPTLEELFMRHYGAESGVRSDEVKVT